MCFEHCWHLQDTQRARFITAICGLGHSEKDSNKEWVPCDPLAFAVALDRSLVLAEDSMLCKVETQAADQRGQTSFADKSTDTSLPKDQCGVVCKISKVDVMQFSEAIIDCVDATKEYLGTARHTPYPGKYPYTP